MPVRIALFGSHSRRFLAPYNVLVRGPLVVARMRVGPPLAAQLRRSQSPLELRSGFVEFLLRIVGFDLRLLELELLNLLVHHSELRIGSFRGCIKLAQEFPDPHVSALRLVSGFPLGTCWPGIAVLGRFLVRVASG